MCWRTPDLAEFLALAALDPVVNVFVDYRARTTRLDRRWLGGEVWGRFVDGQLVSACHVGANLVPVQAGPEDVAAFADASPRPAPRCRVDRRPAGRGRGTLGRRSPTTGVRRARCAAASRTW